MKQTFLSAWRLGSLACLLVLHLCTVTASRAAILAGPITNAANGHIYYLLSPTNWPGAEAEAVSLNGHLATINDVAENTWVFSTFASYGGIARTLWLGLNDAAQEGQWVWVSGEAAAYRKWAPGEPNNGGDYFPDEDQAVMRGPALAYSDSWNDAPGNQVHAAVVEVTVAAPPTNTGAYDVASGFSTNSNPNGAWSYGSSATLGGPMTLLPDRGNWAGLDYWRASILLGVPGVYHNPANITVTNGTGTAILGPGQLSFYPGPNGEFCIIRFTAPTNGLYQVSGAFTGVDPHGTTTDVHVLVNGVTFNGSVNGYGAGSGPTFNLIVDFDAGAPIDFVVGRSANSQFSFDSTGLSVQISTSNAPPASIPPAITSQPQSRTVNAGTNVTFFVTATGTTPLSYQWRRNETNLAGATGTSLTLSNVQPANAGTYSVRVTNAFGAVTSSNAVLTVLAPPPPILAGPVTNPANGHVYYLIGSNTWTGAEAQAVNLGGHLVTINDATENAWVLNTFGSFGGVARPLWIGLNDAALEGAFVWVSGEAATYRNWMPGEPNNGGGFVPDEDYVAMRGPGLSFSNAWNDTLNSDLYVGVVEIGSTVSPTNCVSAPTGLVSWWRAESNAVDSVDSNHGTLAGNATFGVGRVGQGFVFDGNGDGVGIGNPTNLQLQTFTIEAWVRRASSSAITLGGGSSAEFFCYGIGGYAFGFLNDGRIFLSKVEIDQTQTSASITDTNFHHAAVTKSGSNVVFYIDGTAYPVPPYNTTYTFATPAAIGARGDNLTGSFYGTIDELAIYNRALSASEVQGIYTAAGFGKCGPSGGIPPTITSHPQSRTVNAGTNVTFFVTATGTTPLSYQWRRNETNLAGATGSSLTLTNVQPANAGTYSVRVTNAFGAVTSSNAVLTVLAPPTNCVSAPTGLVSWWRAESNTVDSVDSNHGTLAGNATFGVGRAGQGFVFDGNGDGVRIGNPTNLQLQNFTIEAWIKRASTARASFDFNGGIVFGYGYGGYNLAIFDNGTPLLGRVGINYVTPNASITDTNFHHLAVTKSGSTVVFYIDGTAYAVPSYSTTFTFSSPVAIGASGDNLVNSFYGAVDEASIYNRALGSNEIAAIYAAGSAGKCGPSGGIPPTITSHPQNLTVPAGTNVTFTATATGTTPLSYQWRRNETNLAGATGTSLTLSNVQPANAGTYSVRVSNAFGFATSSNAVLTVAVAAYDVSANYSLAANPNGVWRYGALSNLAGPLTLLTFSRTFGAENGVPIGEWNPGGVLHPHINKVLGPGTAVSAGGAFVGLAGTVYFTPGEDGTAHNFGVIRFTVPAGGAGNYRIVTAVQPLFDGAASADADFHVDKNGVQLFVAALSPNQGTSYSNTIALAAGDTIDFAIGRGADGVLGTTGLKIQATLAQLTGTSGGALGFTSLVREPGATAKLCFAGVSGNTYTVQASTNLIDWKVVGIAVADSNGVCQFEDPDSTKFPCRYYRIVVPY